MGKIHLLDKSTIDQIAAGEVIDRPVSVVKELTENAIDAGAAAITVEIEQGGISMIRVTDNGGGIASEDLHNAFLRHSTSKISQADDLLTVASLGFRGEALSSIAAVSRTEMITRTHTSLVGSRYVIEGGQELTLEEAGAPEGTTIIVRDLFFNTPARKKFLKSPQTEGSYISDMVSRLALSRPDISFRLIMNGQTKIHTSGNHNLKDAIYHIFGRELTRQMIPVTYKSSFFQVDGFIGKPVVARGNRSCEIYFINKRYIRSNIVCKAIEEGYRNFLMQHKFPFTVFHITIDPEFTDVNVHPSKMELRFRNQEYLYEELTAAVRKALTEGELSPDMNVPSAGRTDRQAGQGQRPVPGAGSGSFLDSQAPADSNRTDRNPAGINRTDREPAGRNPAGMDRPFRNQQFSGQRPQDHTYPDPDKKTEEAAGRLPHIEPFEVTRSSQYIKEEQAAFEARQAEDLHQQHLFKDKILSVDALSEIRLIGQVFDTYWIMQYHDQLMIIDQHAAHEKVNYERIIKELKGRTYTTQQMNPPAIVTLTPGQQLQFEQMKGVLAETGFEIEPFGGSEYAVYGMPDNLTGMDPMDFLMELLENAPEPDESDRRKNKDNVMTPDAIYEKAASMACKASIKGKQHISFAEAEHLLAELVTLENPYTCPHGRPVMIRMTERELEKEFKRIL